MYVKLPEWLDKIIFEEFEGRYEPRPEDVVFNPNKPYEFVMLYLGTYFPRSCAEAYGIINRLMSNEKYKESLYGLEEVNIMDFCCGTGGEIIGTIIALHEFLPNLRRIRIDAWDANADAIRFLLRFNDSINKCKDIPLSINIIPRSLYVQGEREIQDIIAMSNVRYQFIMSFKAINEFVQSNTFNDRNPYELISSSFFSLLASNGVLIIEDITTKFSDQYFPKIMNKGINEFVRSSQNCSTIVPISCYFYENQCHGCYMQDVFYVTHSRKEKDPTKVAYRILCNKSFADKIMKGESIKSCRATTPNANKNLPYQ